VDEILMRIQQPTNTVVMVGATRPEPSLEKEMEARGITVRWARTIEEAAALLKSAVNRTVVVTELALKDGNWRDLLETVRYSSIPVLLVSSTRTAELWWDALDCGVEDILAAPLSASRLCEYLQKQFTSQNDRS
jgi:DNA-binding NtrC family response regulator